MHTRPEDLIPCSCCAHYGGSLRRNPRYVFCRADPRWPNLIVLSNTWRHCALARPRPESPLLAVLATASTQPQSGGADPTSLTHEDAEPVKDR
jgi:hypothetical protein